MTRSEMAPETDLQIPTVGRTLRPRGRALRTLRRPALGATPRDASR